MARPAATVYFVLMLTSVRATELTADWPTMEVGALKEATAASRPSMAISERRDSVEVWRRHRAGVRKGENRGRNWGKPIMIR